MGTARVVLGDVKVVSGPGQYRWPMIGTTETYPFGMAHPRRSGGSYRYGWQGMERDTSASAGGYTTPYREYDARLGRWMSTDPVSDPSASSYQAMNDKPVNTIDPSGAVGESPSAGGSPSKPKDNPLDPTESKMRKRISRGERRLASAWRSLRQAERKVGHQLPDVRKLLRQAGGAIATAKRATNDYHRAGIRRRELQAQQQAQNTTPGSLIPLPTFGTIGLLVPPPGMEVAPFTPGQSLGLLRKPRVELEPNLWDVVPVAWEIRKAQAAIANGGYLEGLGYCFLASLEAVVTVATFGESAPVSAGVRSGAIGSFIERGAQRAASEVVTTGSAETGTNVFHGVTSPGVAQSVLDGINPKFFNLYSRFGRALYVADDGAGVVAEMAHHGSQPTQVIRYNFNANQASILDLTNPSIAANWGYSGGPITEATRAIGPRAMELGYEAILYQSERGPGLNYAILRGFDRLLSPQMIVPFP